MVAIVHNDNKDWSIKKICDYIAGRNDDFEELGFSSRTIYNYLDEENRKLIDTTKQKGKNSQNNVLVDDDEAFHHIVPEDSSSEENDLRELTEPTTQQDQNPDSSEEESREIYDSKFIDDILKENDKLKEVLFLQQQEEKQTQKEYHYQEEDLEETKQKTDEIKKQLPKEVVEYAEKVGGLSTHKLELLTNKRLKKYPELQKHLIEKIKDKEKITDEIKVTDNKARDIVHQTINDLETGYLRLSETGKVFTYGDPLKRDLIKGNKREAKDPHDYYMELHTACK